MSVINVFQILSKSFANGRTFQLFFVGDSLTYGIGTTGTGSSSSGIVGTNTYPDQTMSKLTSLNATKFQYGYPGQTSQWYINNQLQNTIQRFSGSYTDIFCAVFFGANDVCNSALTATQIYNSIKAIHVALRNVGAKTIVVPLLNRKDAYSLSDTNTKRLAVNDLLRNNYLIFADRIVHTENQPNLYSDTAPDNSTYFAVSDADGLSNVHLTDAGANLLSIEVSNEILGLRNISTTPSVVVIP